MAAASLTNYHSTVFGNQRISEGTLTAINNGDTVTLNGMKKILDISFTPTTNASFGWTISGNVATIVSGGALTGVAMFTGV